MSHLQTSYRYQVGGALPLDIPSYIPRESDKQLYQALSAGEFCYILNCRQMGKSSLMVRTKKALEERGILSSILDFSAKDSQADQGKLWYNGIINKLNLTFKPLPNIRPWLKETDYLSGVELLEEFIDTILLEHINQPIVIFIDEIDSTINLPFTDDFFTLIRSCYNKRAENSRYNRLTFALVGVATPTELIKDSKRTPFNIGKAIDLQGFTLAEAQPLALGLTEKAANPQVVLAEIMHWSGGQPFLTQRLCQIVLDFANFICSGAETSEVARLVQEKVISNWESQDAQEHLKTIKQRLLSKEQKAGFFLELYRNVRATGGLPCDNTTEERELQLTGLVVKREEQLRVYNPIYEAVFNDEWLDEELKKLRPYAESFRAWVASGKEDEDRLLRGNALVEAQEWSRDRKNLSFEDSNFLAASEARERRWKMAIQEQEAVKRTLSIGVLIVGCALLLAGGFGWYARQAKLDLDKAKSELNRAESNTRELKIEAQRATKAKEKATKDADTKQQEAEEARERLEEANQKAEEAQEYLRITKSEKDELSGKILTLKTQADQASQDIEKTNQALESIKSLTRIAALLRKQGEKKAAEKAVNRAVLSTFIEDEQLKKAWSLAATALAQRALAHQEKDQEKQKEKIRQAQENSKESLNTFLKIMPKNDTRTYHQVGAFVYLTTDIITGKNQYAQLAYKHYKSSKYYPYEKDSNIDTANALLDENDIEAIYYFDIQSRKIDINSETDKVAKEFRKYLYDSLEYLLEQGRLRDADIKTGDIFAYITNGYEKGYIESLQNLSCPALKAINEKWEKYPSKPGHYGFRVQRQIWQEEGSPNFNSSYEEWAKFWRRVGWLEKNDKGEDQWVRYDNYEAFRNVWLWGVTPSGNLPSNEYPLQIQNSWAGERIHSPAVESGSDSLGDLDAVGLSSDSMGDKKEVFFLSHCPL